VKWWWREHPPAVTEDEREAARRLRARVDRAQVRTDRLGEVLDQTRDAFTDAVREAIKGKRA
jgi:hypothetical protein